MWTLPPDAGVTAQSRKFTVAVTRLACSGGVTGEVLQPTMKETGSRVTITFEVASLGSGDFTCPGNDEVLYRIALDEPIGERELFDGQCSKGNEAATTSFCEDGGVRWPGKSNHTDS